MTIKPIFLKRHEGERLRGYATFARVVEDETRGCALHIDSLTELERILDLVPTKDSKLYAKLSQRLPPKSFGDYGLMMEAPPGKNDTIPKVRKKQNKIKKSKVEDKPKAIKTVSGCRIYENADHVAVVAAGKEVELERAARAEAKEYAKKHKLGEFTRYSEYYNKQGLLCIAIRWDKPKWQKPSSRWQRMKENAQRYGSNNSQHPYIGGKADGNRH